ncbi:MAG: hypothetical protein R3E97_13010 [Candidatus Eisenbacteria bacterium]
MIDVTGRMRVTLQGNGTGIVDWDLTDSRGARLESGVFWVTSGNRRARIVVVIQD